MKKIVISDTTALIVFAKSDTLFLLSNLFKKVYIPKAVYDELKLYFLLFKEQGLRISEELERVFFEKLEENYNRKKSS